MIADAKIVPLSADRWNDFERLFGPNGSCGGCWCTWWLLTHKEFNQLGDAGRKETMRTIVQQGKEPGLLAYVDGVPAGWVALAPRTNYVRLNTSRKLAAVDDQPVWVISCFVVHRSYRKQGLTDKLISAACEYARQKGATLIEAFPIKAEPKSSPVSIFTGVESTFLRQGFKVAVEREGRSILRKSF